MRSRPARRPGRKPGSSLRRLLELLEDRTVPDASLSLTVSPSALWEYSGPAAATGTVTRSGFDLSVPLTVSLSSSDTTEVTVPSSVTIPAGQVSATFPVNAIDDSVVDGTQSATITASATAPGSGLTGPISYDTTWGNSGWVGNGNIVGALAVQPDGKLVTAGIVAGSGTNYYDFYLARYNANGTADTTFGSPYGNVRLDVTGQKDLAKAVAVQGDGKIVVAGTGGNGPNFDWIVARFNANGTPDTTFGTGGKVVIDRSAGYDELWDVALQSDGKIVLSGNLNGVFSVGRLNPDGSLDGTFGGGGTATTTFGSSLGSRAFGVAIQSDGKVVAAGTLAGGNSTSTYAVARYNPDGTPDASFGSGGTVQTDFPGVYDGGYDVAVQNGKIVVAGMTGRLTAGVYDVGLVRYNADGSLDTSFGSGGTVVGTAGGVYAPVRLALQSDGRIVAVGSTGSSRGSSYGKIFRYSPDGVLENSTNSMWVTSVAENLALDPSGGIYLAYTYGGTASNGYVDKYKSSGIPVSATATVTVADNDPFTAANDSYTLDQNSSLTVPAPGVMANDTFAAPNSPRVVRVNDPGSIYSGPSHGTVTLNADGSFTYTPTAGYYGTDTFYYRVVDGGASTGAASVTLTVRRTSNTLPVSRDDSYTVAEDTPLVTVLAPEAAAGNSLYMVSDPGDYIGQGKTWSYGPTTASYSMYNPYPSNPTYSNAVSLSVSTSTDYWTFDFWAPYNARFVAGTTYTGVYRFPFNSPSQPGMDVSGDYRGSNTLTGQFTVLQAEYDLTGKLTRFSVQFEQHSEGATPALRGTLRYNFLPSQLGVLNNDTDADGDRLTASLVTGPSHGTLTLNADGTFRYTPQANWSGTDSFTYKANDTYGDGNVATATITVNAVDDLPASADDGYETDEDTPLTVAAPGVLGNDADVEGDPLTASLVRGPAHGTLSFKPDGSFTYTPYADWNGTDFFTYRANDGTGYGNTATVTLTVNPVYDPPVARDDAYTVVPGTAYTASAPGVLGNDTSPDGLAMTAELADGPVNGTLTFNADGSFTYTRTPGTTGPDSFTYQAFDGIGYSTLATVRLNVAPTGYADPYTVAEDATLTVPIATGVLANDTDPDGDRLTAYLYTYPAHGSLNWYGDGSFTYTPLANYNGPDSFTYRPYDGIAYGPITTVAVNVTPVNDAPVATNDSYVTAGDAPLVVSLPTSPALTRLTMQSDSGDYIGLGRTYDFSPATGTFSAYGNANYLTVYYGDSKEYWSLTFAGVGTNPLTPGVYLNAERAAFRSPGHPGLDVTGDSRGSNTLTGQFTVYQVVADSTGKILRFAADFDQHSDGITPALHGQLRYNYTGMDPLPVLDNDTDVDRDALSAVLVSGPAHGTLTLNADGTFTYTPQSGYTGTDSFTYKANDGRLDSNVATVTITVNPGNRRPTAVADSYSATEDTPLTVPAAGVLGNDTDPDGDTLFASLVSGPAHGTLTLNANGSFTYAPAANYSGTDSFTYKASDGQLTSDPVTVTLTVAAVNDPPAAAPDSYTTAEDTPLTVAVPGVLANDTDVDGDPLTAVLVSGPAHGTLTLNADGSFTYTPAANWNGTDSFSYRPNDGTANGNTATVTITVTPVNDPPAAADDSYSLAEDTPLTVSAPGVLGNDSDVDGDALTAVLVSGPAHGTLTLSANGSFTYAPAANYNGPDSFTYKAGDGTASGTATVRLTVTPVNDAPQAADDAYATDEDTALTVAAPGVLGNDTDADGDTLSAILVSGPSHGTLTLGADGRLTYNPAPDYNGSDSFTYKVNDGTTDGSTATVRITVRAVNDPPVARTGDPAPDNVQVTEGQVRTFDVSPSYDVDGDPLTYTWDFGDGSPVVTTGPGGTNPGQLGHAFPDQGTYTVRVTVSDPSGASSAVTFTVHASNVAPGGSMSGPSTVVPGQEFAVTLTAGDPGPADMAAPFTYLVTWGDGTTTQVTGPASGVTVTKTYAGTGTFNPFVSITDKDGATGQGVASLTVGVVPAAVIGGTLYVGGTTGADTITVKPADGNGGLTVVRNGATLGTYYPTADVAVFGQAGADQISVTTAKIRGTTYSVARPVYLFGGDDNDTLDARGSVAGAVLSGGAGDDSLSGGAGDDIPIGGAGTDTLRGGNGGDILIGGLFDFDGSLDVLRKLGAEWWRADADLATRIAHLKGTAPGGYNTVALDGTTIHNDGVADQLYGEGGTDWFFNHLSGVKDSLRDFASGEERTDV